MKTQFGVWKKVSLVATSGVLALGIVGCSGPSDEADGGSGDKSTSTQSSDGSDASDGGVMSDGGGASDAGKDSAADSGKYGPDVDLRTTALPIDAKDAVSTAQGQVGEGTLHAVELDYDRKAEAWQWDVKILAGSTDHKVVVDAVTGEIVADETETTDDEEKAIDLEDPLTFDEALDAATAEHDGELRGWKLEYDDGMVQYQFDIASGSDEHEVTVDVETADVTMD